MALPYDVAKAIALKWLPQAIVNRLKKSHYLKKVTNISKLDEPELEIVQCLVAHGDYVVDLGANIGVYTVFMSRLVASPGRVFSFEPVATTFRFLENNVSRLGLQNVILRQAAITDRPCRVAMAVPKDEGGAENFYQASIDLAAKQPGENVMVVDGLPLDQAISADIGRIAFIKCDVEGHELHCLHGATEVISRSRPAWLMEVGGDPTKLGSNAAAVFAFMRDKNYSIWVFRQGKIEPWAPGLRSVNYLFLQSGHVDKLRGSSVLKYG